MPGCCLLTTLACLVSLVNGVVWRGGGGSGGSAIGAKSGGLAGELPKAVSGSGNDSPIRLSRRRAWGPFIPQPRRRRYVE